MNYKVIKEVFNLVQQYNSNLLNPAGYFEKVKEITGLKFDVCTSCPESIKKVHNDIQITCWRNLFNLRPDWKFDYTFNTFRLNTPYFKEQLLVIGDDIVQSNVSKLKTDRNLVNYGKINLTMNQLVSDINLMQEVLKIKKAPYSWVCGKESEDTGLSNKELIIKLFNQGMGNPVIAEIVGVSNQYVHKVLKKYHEETADKEDTGNIAVKETNDNDIQPAGEVNNEEGGDDEGV